MKLSKNIKNEEKIKIKGLLGKNTIVSNERIKDKYGYIPTSVWKLPKTNHTYNKILNLKGAYSEFHSKKETIPIAEFNPEMVKRCLQIWSKKDSIVLDPFMHSGIVPLLSAYYGKKSYGIDLIESYVTSVKKVIFNLKKEEYIWADNINVKCDDISNIVEIAKEWDTKFDYILTSPPFWNIRKYSSTEGQLSDINDYVIFLEKYMDICSDLYEIMNRNSYVSFVVADFRKDGVFYPFGSDTILALKSAGFKPHDIVINVTFSQHVKNQITRVESDHHTMKFHEYIITVRKE